MPKDWKKLLDLTYDLHYNNKVMKYKSYIELEHIATSIPHTEPLNTKECQLFLEGSDASHQLAFDSIADRMDLKVGMDESGVYEDHLGNHYFTEKIVVDGITI